MGNLRKAIDNRGIRYNWIAQNVLGISRQNFHNKLTGQSRFTDEQKAKLAAFLSVPVEELFPEAAEVAVGATS